MKQNNSKNNRNSEKHKWNSLLWQSGTNQINLSWILYKLSMEPRNKKQLKKQHKSYRSEEEIVKNSDLAPTKYAIILKISLISLT